MLKNERAVQVSRPNTARATTKSLAKSIPQKRRKRYTVTLTRDFWGIMAIIAVSILMPVLHMLLCMWGGVA